MSIDVAKEPNRQRTIITLDWPEKKNALTVEMLADLHDAVVDLKRDIWIRAIVPTGAGDAFCADADVNEFREGLRSALSEITYWYQKTLHKTYAAFETCSLPVVKVNGIANGAGGE